MPVSSKMQFTESLLRTPSYKLNEADESGGVYPPAEDTFLLMDALEADQEFLRSLNPHLALEIGCGSGVVTAFLHQLLHSSTDAGESARLFSLAVDVNRQALDCTRRTLRANGISDEKWDVVECDLGEPLLTRLEGRVDVLLMNPPYVPTECEPTMEVKDLYYAGGAKGRHLVDRLLPRVPKLLTPRRGVFYLVAMRENRMEQVQMPAGLKGRVVLERRCGIEHLSVWRFDTDRAGE